MRFTSRLVVSLVTALVLSGEVRGQSVSVLLQKGIFAEETTGDLDAAIKIYEQILAQDQASRSHVVRAQYRLATCYLKKGQKVEAAAAFEKLIERFPEQKAHVAQARARLAEFGGSAEPTARRILDGFTSSAVPSRDGKYIAYLVDYPGNLGVRELATGENRLLVDGAVMTYQKSAYAHGCAFSPDGDQIAYAWRMDQINELRIISVQGGEPRTVYRMPDEVWPSLRGWSSDRKFLLVVLSKRNAQGPAATAGQLALVDVTEGSLRVLKSLAYRRGVRANLSPDGKLVAYSARANAQSRRHDVYLLSLEDGEERAVVQHPADDILVGWAPDGGQIVFASDRSGTKDLWTLDVVGVNTGKRARLVKTGIGHFTPLGITADGTLYYYSGKAPAMSTPRRSTRKPANSWVRRSALFDKAKGTTGPPTGPRTAAIWPALSTDGTPSIAVNSSRSLTSKPDGSESWSPSSMVQTSTPFSGHRTGGHCWSSGASTANTGPKVSASRRARSGRLSGAGCTQRGHTFSRDPIGRPMARRSLWFGMQRKRKSTLSFASISRRAAKRRFTARRGVQGQFRRPMAGTSYTVRIGGGSRLCRYL